MNDAFMEIMKVILLAFLLFQKTANNCSLENRCFQKVKHPYCHSNHTKI